MSSEIQLSSLNNDDCSTDEYSGNEDSSAENENDSNEDDECCWECPNCCRTRRMKNMLGRNLKKKHYNESHNNFYNNHLSPEEILKKQQELILEEEAEKRKIIKRKEKKKKQREKRRSRKEERSQGDDKNFSASSNSTGSSQASPNSSRDFSLNEENNHFPLYSQHFHTCKKKVNSTQGQFSSKKFAIEANKQAQDQNYEEAIKFYSKAVKAKKDELSEDFRVYGNRSFCYERMGIFDKALEDAHLAIQLASHQAKPYFRKGRALLGLKNYDDALKAFEEVMKREPACAEAKDEIDKIKTTILLEMGFPLADATEALQGERSVQDALSLLLPFNISLSNSKNVENEETASSTTSEPFIESKPAKKRSNDGKISPASSSDLNASANASESKFDQINPNNSVSLWLGNLMPEVNENRLFRIFSVYGAITSIHILPTHKHCGFINFKKPEEASAALTGMQGQEVCGQNLLIKFPSTGDSSSKIPSSANGEKRRPKTESVKFKDANEECYFWRTTGCQYGKDCRFVHIKTSKGVDQKPWHKPQH